MYFLNILKIRNEWTKKAKAILHKISNKGSVKTEIAELLICYCK
jgi:hypothetical protein